MPDLLATFQINASLPGLVPAVPLRATPVALAGPAAPDTDFGAALVGLLVPGVASKAKGERQPDAERGKDLPAEDGAAPDPLLAWLPADAAPIPLAPATAPPEGEPTAAGNTGIEPAPLPATTEPAPETTPLPATDIPATLGDRPAVPGPAPQSEPAEPDAVEPHRNPAASAVAAARLAAEQGSIPAVVAAPALRMPRTELSVPVPTVPSSAVPSPTVPSLAALPEATAPETPALELEPEVELAAPPLPRGRFDAAPARAAGQPAPAFVSLPAAPPATGNSGIAAQVFAAAITSFAADPAPADRVNDATVLLQGRIEQQAIVQAMSGTSQTPLDMSRDDWTGAMIERIAALRDSAEAADTRIKLAPENLGALEVSIRREGDRIHVHFTADNPAARQLIAEAAPRLVELADARGVKLGQTSVDSGSQQGAPRDQQPQTQTAARNASTARRAEPVTDDRIA